LGYGSTLAFLKSVWLHIGFLLLLAGQAAAQVVGNERVRVVYPKQTLAYTDSLTIVPESLQLGDGDEMLDPYVRVENQRILLDSALLRYDSLSLRYRVFPFDLAERYQHLDSAQAKPLEDGLIGIAYNPYAQEGEALNFRGLNYNGNFTRGISFGNNQDLVLNSSFNLQLAGELGDGIEILAAITDENIPIQPEGNTQQLREFDRIFIQLQKDSNRLIAGDYELQRPNSYFMNYFKKLQGATFSNRAALGKGYLRSNASVAISRGQFTRNRIEAIEGNQGPYKLRGGEGERFIIVLSGTEKIFLDGELMTRGLEQDYVIDYNRGEVTFTNQRLITKDSRIVAEFEYADQNYVRSLYAAGTSYERGRLQLDFNLFNQQDSKNATGELGLTDETKRLLSQAGDEQTAAVVPSIDTLEEFTPFRVAYRLEDTLLSCGVGDTLVQYLVFTTEDIGTLYTASFSFVGEGNGAYELAEAQTANERVYRWVGYGADCQPLGDFAPVRQVTPPRQQQLFTLGGAYELGKDSKVRAEVGMSRNDLNRFSNLDSGDDIGFSAYTELAHRFQLGSDSSGWSLGAQASYEWVQANFEPLNPYRNPEFLRDWSLADVQGRGDVARAEEQIGKGGISLRKKGLGNLNYELSLFNRDSIYTGWQHRWQLREQLERWQVELDGSWLNAESTTLRNQFLRPRATLAYTLPILGGLKVGAYGEQERNERYGVNTDTLQSNSFYYNRYRLFLESEEQQGRSWGSSYSQRIDYAPVGEQFLTSTLATEANINGKWNVAGGGNRLQLAGNFTYRQLEIQRPETVAQEPGETFLGRADLNFTVLKGVMQSATTYEIGSGQEAKIEFTYLRVNPGEGDYIWLDSLYNNDGVIQPNEMEIAPFQDLADYVRITAVTDEFIRTDNVRLNQSLRLTPKALLFDAKGWKKVLGRFSTISNLTINRKTQEAEEVAAWNPFQLDVADTSLVAVSSNIRNVLFFNQADPIYDLQLGMNDSRNKFVQTSGFESRRNSEQYVRGRWNISKAVSTNVDFTWGQRTSDSEFFNEKDFEIQFLKFGPSLTLLPSRNFRSTVRYNYQSDEDQLPGSEAASQRHDVELEARYNRSAQTSVQLRASFVQVDFQGQPNSPVGFAILNGLQDGQNFLWNISLDQQLARNIQLRLSYEGRKTGDANIVHTGRAQVAANF
jgi:hypothetical protein